MLKLKNAVLTINNTKYCFNKSLERTKSSIEYCELKLGIQNGVSLVTYLERSRNRALAT